MGTLAETLELPSIGPLGAPNLSKLLTPRKKNENLNVFFYVQIGAQELSLEGGETGSEERASIHFPRTAGPRGGSLVTRTVALLVHAHFRPGPASSPAVSTWVEGKKKKTDKPEALLML